MNRCSCGIQVVVAISLLVAGTAMPGRGDEKPADETGTVTTAGVGGEIPVEPPSAGDEAPQPADAASAAKPDVDPAPATTADADVPAPAAGEAAGPAAEGDAWPEAEAPPVDPHPADPDRVRFRLDVEGEMFATVGADAPPLRLPTKLEARFDFLESPAAGADGSVVERRYVDAAADLSIDGSPRRIALAADARVVRFAIVGTTPAPFLASGHLTREELDLLETPFDPLLSSAIRPQATVAEHDSWQLPADATAGLLAIDTVESGQIDARLTRVVDGVATVVIAGIVDGAVDGVPTHVTVEGTCSLPVTAAADGAFHLDRPPTSAAVTIRERREAGHVAPGFDIEARVSFVREPAAPGACRDVDDDARPARPGGPGRPGLVWHRDALGRFEIVHDGRWRAIEDGHDGLVMRLVDRGALVAQSSVTALPRGPAADPPTIADVERDLLRSLAGQATGIEHASEARRSDGVRIVRVVAIGKAGDLPFRWTHAVLTDSVGHRVVVTCMLESTQRDRFGTADRDLVDGIVLPAGDGSGREQDGGPIAREARLPPDSPPP